MLKDVVFPIVVFIALSLFFFWVLCQAGEDLRGHKESLRQSYNRLALKRHRPELTKEEVAPVNIIQLNSVYTKLLEGN